MDVDELKCDTDADDQTAVSKRTRPAFCGSNNEQQEQPEQLEERPNGHDEKVHNPLGHNDLWEWHDALKSVGPQRQDDWLRDEQDKRDNESCVPPKQKSHVFVRVPECMALQLVLVAYENGMWSAEVYNDCANDNRTMTRTNEYGQIVMDRSVCQPSGQYLDDDPDTLKTLLLFLQLSHKLISWERYFSYDGKENTKCLQIETEGITDSVPFVQQVSVSGEEERIRELSRNGHLWYNTVTKQLTGRASPPNAFGESVFLPLRVVADKRHFYHFLTEQLCKRFDSQSTS